MSTMPAMPAMPGRRLHCSRARSFQAIPCAHVAWPHSRPTHRVRGSSSNVPSDVAPRSCAQNAIEIIAIEIIGLSSPGAQCAACGSRPSYVNVGASGRPGRLSMIMIFAGAALVIIGIVFMAAQPLWRGRLSREPEPGNAETLSPRASNTLEPRRPARGFGMKFNWPGLAMVAAGFLLLLIGAAS
jgi:uncharacterized membrane protein